MKIRIAGTALGLTVLATGALAVPTQAGAATASAEERALGTKSLAKVLAADGTKFDSSWKDFDILEKAVLTVLDAKPDSPVGILTRGKKRLTAFVPTDAAFRALVEDLTGKAPKTERATFNKLASLAGVDTVETVLLYHVVPGATIRYAQAKAADGATLDTAQGGTLTVNVVGDAVRLQDADRNDKNATVIAAAKNINKGNKQIAHGINRVLRPIDL